MVRERTLPPQGNKDKCSALQMLRTSRTSASSGIPLVKNGVCRAPCNSPHFHLRDKTKENHSHLFQYQACSHQITPIAQWESQNRKVTGVT
ncbi:Uncharacterised protein [Vibrio cholerae]|nr:Uncharacterised protein [Vibrio cholerae]